MGSGPARLDPATGSRRYGRADHLEMPAWATFEGRCGQRLVFERCGKLQSAEHCPRGAAQVAEANLMAADVEGTADKLDEGLRGITRCFRQGRGRRMLKRDDRIFATVHLRERHATEHQVTRTLGFDRKHSLLEEADGTRAGSCL